MVDDRRKGEDRRRKHRESVERLCWGLQETSMNKKPINHRRSFFCSIHEGNCPKLINNPQEPSRKCKNLQLNLLESSTKLQESLRKLQELQQSKVLHSESLSNSIHLNPTSSKSPKTISNKFSFSTSLISHISQFPSFRHLVKRLRKGPLQMHEKMCNYMEILAIRSAPIGISSSILSNEFIIVVTLMKHAEF
jgi:hypothetical protein